MYNLINNASPLRTTSKLVLQMIHRIINASADHIKCTVTLASSPDPFPGFKCSACNIEQLGSNCPGDEATVTS